MQNPVVVIGGLEKSYMQKLALYLNTRIGKDGYVELLEGSARQTDMVHQNVNHQREKHWELAVGSESFVEALQEAGQAEQILILTDTEEEDETHISQYQSRAVLFQKIIARYHSIASIGMPDDHGKATALDRLHWWKPGNFDGCFCIMRMDTARETACAVCRVFGKQRSDIGVSTGVWDRRSERFISETEKRIGDFF